MLLLLQAGTIGLFLTLLAIIAVASVLQAWSKDLIIQVQELEDGSVRVMR